MKNAQRGAYTKRCRKDVPMQVGGLLLLFAPLFHYRSGVPAHTHKHTRTLNSPNKMMKLSGACIHEVHELKGIPQRESMIMRRRRIFSLLDGG